MIVYLAELSHTGVGRSPNTIPLSIGFLAAVARKNFPDIEIRLFRDPDLLLEAATATPPDIMGFSIRLWSERVSSFCAARVKERSPQTVIVAGGPTIDDLDPELIRFLREEPAFDLCIPGEGENGFLRLIEQVKAHGCWPRVQAVPGCATLAADGFLLRGAYAVPDLADIPSPYLEGIMDSFLDEGYDPIIQSMRGCPFGCTFCVSGTKAWSRLRSFELSRVFAEIDYVRERTRGGVLILTDENLGILRERDVALAEYLINSHREYQFPTRLYFYTSKRVTDYVRKTVEILSPIGEFGMSFQTLNEDVIRTIHRTNLTPAEFLANVQWARDHRIITSTEMIFGFPGETMDSYLTGLEWLLRSGVDRVYSYNLRLFNGIDLASRTDRERFHYRTRFRLPERTFGVYQGSVVTEVEEVVVGAKSFDDRDYRMVRKYGLFLELACGRGYFSELIRLMLKASLPGDRLIRFWSGHSFASYPRLRGIIGEYLARAADELFDTPDECARFLEGILAAGKPVPEVKLNLIFSGRIMLEPAVRKELFGTIREFIAAQTPDASTQSFFQDYLDNVLEGQIVSFRKGEETILQRRSAIRPDRLLEKDAGSSLADLQWPDGPRTILMHPDAARLVEANPLIDPVDEKRLQDIYMSMSRFGLLRRREST